MNHLKRLHAASYKLKPQQALLFRAMTSIAFFGFLRPSEYCASNSGHQLQRRDIKFGKSNMCCYLRLRSYKHSEKPAVITIKSSFTSSMHPVKDIKEYHNNLAPSGERHPLFDVTVQEFGKMLNEVCRLAEIKTKLTPHCFRIGGATWADRHGWSEARIQSHGRWHSRAYKVYIKP